MKHKRRGFVSAISIVFLLLICAMPVQGAVSYSKQCDTVWEYNGGLTIDQYYDGNDWDPMSNSSQSARFWQNLDDVNISLEILLEQNDIGYQSLNFEYTVEAGGSPSSGCKIIEGASFQTDGDYTNTVSVDFDDSDARELYIEVYDVTESTFIQVYITVKVLDGMNIIAWEWIWYEWVGPC